MDLEKMLMMCHRDQWRVEDLDWSVRPRPLSRAHEMAVVQYFKDMAGIELLAGELFKVQRERSEDPTLREIFGTFIVDEVRHSRVAERLAAHYDVHQYRSYEQSPHLARFSKHFLKACHHLTPEIANAYITTGELLLDIALLRSLDDFVDDEMSHSAMRLINRDESRHIAVDYYMVEYYAKGEYDQKTAKEPKKPLGEQLRAAVAFAGFLYHAAPFFKDVFFAPMDLVDPTGRRLREALKRAQLISLKPHVSKRPFVRFMRTLQDLFNHPVSGRLFGPVLARVIGLEPRFIQELYTEEERARALSMDLEEMAQEALQLKYTN